MSNPTNRLARMRDEAGVTREAVAYHLGVSAKTPYNWEHMPDHSVKKHHEYAYAEAIRRALADAVIAGYLTAA